MNRSLLGAALAAAAIAVSAAMPAAAQDAVNGTASGVEATTSAGVAASDKVNLICRGAVSATRENSGGLFSSNSGNGNGVSPPSDNPE